jgi:hypothetical protein
VLSSSVPMILFAATSEKPGAPLGISIAALRPSQDPSFASADNDRTYAW